jgi:predicted nucleotidyltransferase
MVAPFLGTGRKSNGHYASNTNGHHASNIGPLASGSVFVQFSFMVKRAQIRAFSEAVAREFHPRKVVLFGSYAYGHPTVASDVDLLVVMDRTRLRGERMSVRIRQAIPRDFPLDLLVRTPSDVAKRLRWGDPFIRELMNRGEVLYEAPNA